MDQYQSSSPDPLGLSQGDAQKSPMRGPRPSISPRKPLSDASGNARTQDFYISTPPAKRRSYSGKISNDYQEELESPWRIRLTVQAERLDGQIDSALGGNILQNTTTTTVPLKGGDDGSPPVKRGRGRPRKSLEARNGNGTPGPKQNPLRNRLQDFDSSSVIDSWAPTPPRKTQKARGKKRASTEQSMAGEQSSPARPLPSPRRATPERTVKARPFSRSRSRSRRKEITPRKLGSSIVLDDVAASELEASVSSAKSRSQAEQSPLLRSVANEDLSNRASSPAIVDQHPSSVDRSAEDIEDEKMWRAMIQKDSVSPSPPESAEPQLPADGTDPTDEHQDFDTILESEGFSMVSVDSLQSTSSGGARIGSPNSPRDSPALGKSDDFGPRRSDAGGNGINQRASFSLKPSHAFATPFASESSPTMPPTPQNIVGQKAGPEFAEEDGTPRSERIARASIVLQSLPSPNAIESGREVSHLASPFGAAKDKASPPDDLDQSTRTPLQPHGPNPDLVCGFSAATRRELRAGLRLGEELAKRYQNSPISQSTQISAVKRGEPRIFSAETDTTLRSNPQLPSPATSMTSGEDDKMSWRSETPQLVASGQANNPGSVNRAGDREIDHTMLAREAEWQREREAVSRQIRAANSSQVIVIDDTELTPSSVDGHSLDGISQIPVKHDSSASITSRVPSQKTPEQQNTSDFAPFRRSKLPSPWTRQIQAEQPVKETKEVTRSMNDSDLFWQPDSAHLEATRKRTVRRKQREASQNSSLLTTSSNEINEHSGTRLQEPSWSRSKVDPTIAQDIDTSISRYEPSSQNSFISNSLHTNLSRIQPASELHSNGESEANLDSFLTNHANIESSSALLAEEALYPDLDSFEANKDRYLRPEHLKSVEDSLLLNKPNIQPALGKVEDEKDEESVGDRSREEVQEDTLDSIEESELEQETTVALAEDVPPAIVPLPGSPSLGALDPDLLANTSECDEDVQELTAAMNSTHVEPVESKQVRKAPTQTQPTSSWWSALTAPLASLISGPSCPAATKEDILVSSPHEPLPWYLPTTSAHLRALQPLVWSSTLYNPAIFPFDSSSPCRYVLGATISTGRGWAREITKADCGIIDAFRVLLRYRGIIPEEGRGLMEGERLTCRHIAGMIVRIWVQMVMEGYVDHREWRGVRTGMNASGDARWNERDIVLDEEDMRFVQMRRQIFTEEGLPSWKARGWKGPFGLAKPL